MTIAAAAPPATVLTRSGMFNLIARRMGEDRVRDTLRSH
jgi:hypothetical protein